MPTAEQVLAVARREIGTREALDGSNKYGRAYGVDRVAWCMQFQWWCFREAHGSALIHPKTAYTPTAAQWFMDRRQWSTTPRVGSLIFFNWPDSVNRIQHVGIVEAVEPNAVVTIEGNTSSGNAGSQDNGGGVWRRRRARNSHIVGFGHPAYSAPSPSPRVSEDIVASLAEVEALLNKVIDARLGRVIWETTGSLPNRRGPGGSEIKGGGSDTLWGYSINADGFGYRIERKIDELAARGGLPGNGGAGVDVNALAAAIAPMVADELARRLAS